LVLDSAEVSNSLPTTHSSRNRESSRSQEQQRSTDRMAYATPLASDIADLKRREFEGRAVATSPHNPKDHPGPLRTSGFIRSARSAPEGRAEGASSGIPREIEGAGRYRDGVETRVLLGLGVRGCPKRDLSKSPKSFEIMVSAAGLEPATHALKGSPNQLQTITCTSSLLHARLNKIKEIQTRHRSGCPEGARDSSSTNLNKISTIFVSIAKWYGLSYDIRDNGLA